MLPVLDAVVFTGGVGEHSGPIRKRIVERLAVLGVREVTGADVREDTVLGEPNSGPTILRVEARKDVVIANGVRALIGIA